MKENQSKTRDKQYQIPMVVTDEVIRDFGIKPEDVTWRRIGNRKCRVVMVDATEAEYKAYMEPIWAEQKRQNRESRCLVPGKGGKLIRCPESNKCEKCSHASEVCHEMNRPASLSFLVDEGAEPVAPGSFEDTVIYESLLEDLIAMLSEIEPKYGEIFRMLYDGATRQKMADKLGMKQWTVSDCIKRIRSIVQPLVKDTFDR
ncbi:MAG: hypothetical protein LUD07_03495 [Clostridiales bacterium]|nr:hypothetical protein [Clostridiales bacterium]